MTYGIIVAIAALLLIPGIAMSFVPALPGLLYMLMVALVFGLYDHFVHMTMWHIAVLATIAIVTMIVDTFSGLIGARLGGAGKWSILAGLVGMVLGTFIIPAPIVGSLVGLFVGILLAEWYRSRNFGQAHKAAAYSFAGSMAGMIIKVGASLLFAILFLVFVL